MTSFFEIGALPRSGTAWLATALNCFEDTFCFHELEHRGGHQFHEVCLQNSFVGNCSPAVPWEIRPLPAEVKVAVVRDFGDCMDSLREEIPSFQQDQLLLDQFSGWLPKSTLSIQFRDLFSWETVSGIAAHIGIQGFKSAKNKVEQLVRLQVQIRSFEDYLARG